MNRLLKKLKTVTPKRRTTQVVPLVEMASLATGPLDEADRKSVGGAILGKSYTLNVRDISAGKAISFAKKAFSDAGLDLYKEIPDFDKNFTLLKKRMKYAKDIPRVMMPVIEPDDLKKFSDDLSKGRVDIFQPWAAGKFGDGKFPWYPELKGGKPGEEWITLGTKDGDPSDDMVAPKPGMLPVKSLKPLQGEIWFDKLIGSLLKFGLPEPGGFLLTNAVIIVSKEGYILDGHHRFGQAMLTDPGLKIRALKVPLGIDLLLKVGRSYGSAIGNVPKESYDPCQETSADQLHNNMMWSDEDLEARPSRKDAEGEEE